MCRMALDVLWYISTSAFTIETVVIPRKSFWNSEKICNMNLGVLLSNSTHGLTLITLLLSGKYLWSNSTHGLNLKTTLLFSGKSLWNSVDMHSVTLEVV